MPKDSSDRADGVKVVFDEAHGHAPPPAEIRTRVQSLPRPQFAYEFQVADTAGDGDGRIERGESVTVYLDVQNTGAGKAMKVTANLRNLGGPGLLLRDGRFELKEMAPGEARRVAFTFDMLSDFEGDAAQVEVSVADTELREFVSEKIRIPVEAKGPQAPTAKTGPVVLKDGTPPHGPSGPSGLAASAIEFAVRALCQIARL